MDIINLAVLIAFLINVGLSTFLLFRAISTKSVSTKYFSFFGYAISFWCFAMFFYRGAVRVENAIIWTKILYVAASLTPSTFFIFALSFLDKEVKSYVKILVAFVNFILVVLIVLTPYFILDVQIPAGQEKIIKFGDLYYWVYALYIPIGFMTSFGVLGYKYWKSIGQVRYQIMFILIGSITTSTLAMITNLTLPNFGIFDLNWFGQISTIIWLLAITYSILRYKLFDIRVLIGRIIYISGMTLLLYVSFYFFINLNIYLFGDLYSLPALAAGVIFAAIYTNVLNYVNRFIRDKVESNLINPGFDPKEVLNNFNAQISTVLDNSKLAELAVKTLSITLRADYEGVLLSFNRDGDAVIIDSKKNDEFNLQLLIDAFTIWDHSGEQPINLDYLDIQLQNEYRNMKSWLEPIVEEMKRTKLHLIYPLKLSSDDRYVGMILMGAKEGNTGYDSVEVKFVKDLAESLSAALARSELHKEVQDLNANLQKKVEEATDELQQKVVALEEARRRERDMLDILGHELRTPLTIVRNAIQMMQVADGAGSLTQEMVKEYLEMADENAKREVSLLETMLTTTKIDNDSLSLLLTKVLLNDVVSDTFAALTQKAERKGLKLLKGEIQDEVFVYADRDRFQEVVDNITDNAVKYTDHGEVKVSIYKDGDNMAAVKVEDTGIGIPKDKIAFLGQKFYRVGNYLDNGNTDMSIVRPGGTGLGLYVVFELAKAMGGRIEVESEMGKGSIFTIYIPLYTGQENKQIGGKKVTVYEKFKELKKKKKSDTEKEQTEESKKEEPEETK